jgi:hypothetical protein
VTSRSRSEDLAADLLQDIAAEQAHPSAPERQAAAEQPSSGDAFVDADFYLAPSRWKRPGIARSGNALSINAGPVRVRLGRRPT